MAMKKYPIDGFHIQFQLPYGSNWKAIIWRNGRALGLAPVTWGHFPHHKFENGIHYQKVYFKDYEEMTDIVKSKKDFAIAIGRCKALPNTPTNTDWYQEDDGFRGQRVEFVEFTCIYRVRPTGHILTPRSIETIVVDRLRNK
jgi:hypothetical protein